MKILKIKRIQETDQCHFADITFKSFLKKPFTRRCYSHKLYKLTYFLDTGDLIYTGLSSAVSAFLETTDTEIDFTKINS